MVNFGASKSDISLKYRLGLERCLAKADFLTNPNLVLVQALSLFLMLVRRHESPRFVWMMTGLLIKAAQYIGLQRDGSHFPNLTPFDIEIRRRVWWIVFQLDIRSAEDQGTEPTIACGSFDTKYPLNINDSDIDASTKDVPAEREGITDMAFALGAINISNLSKQIVALGRGDGASSWPEQNRLLNRIYDDIRDIWFQDVKESESIFYWVGFTMAKMVKAKMTLIAFLPALLSVRHKVPKVCPFEIRVKLLSTAIEVAEHNHALNAEPASRQWRWLYQTCTHWHAVVFLVMEIARRPWSPCMERAFVALHSEWLIPSANSTHQDLRMWVPLRKLMAKARKHREAEIIRLKADPQEADRIEDKDRLVPLPASPGPFTPESIAEVFRKRWRQLLAPDEPQRMEATQADVPSRMQTSQSVGMPASAPASGSVPAPSNESGMSFETACLGTIGQMYQYVEDDNGPRLSPKDPSYTIGSSPISRATQPAQPAIPSTSEDAGAGYGTIPWLWADTDPTTDVFPSWRPDLDVNMDLDDEVNWNSWVESAMTGRDSTFGPQP